MDGWRLRQGQTGYRSPSVRDVGRVVLVDASTHARLRFVGPIPASKKKGNFIGVEFDSAVGNCDGEAFGVALFKCESNHGLVVHEREGRVLISTQASASSSSSFSSNAAFSSDEAVKASAFYLIGYCMRWDVFPSELDPYFDWRIKELHDLAEHLHIPQEVTDKVVTHLISNSFSSPAVELEMICAGEHAWDIIDEVLQCTIRSGKYDARIRTVLFSLCELMGISQEDFATREDAFASMLISASESKDTTGEDRKKDQRKKNVKRWLKIGFGGLVGGAIIGLTGGLAAPLVAAGAVAVFGTAAFVTTLLEIHRVSLKFRAVTAITLPAVLGTLFGLAGGGLTAHKLRRRVGQLEDFQFEPLCKGGLPVTIAVSGWIPPPKKKRPIDKEDVFLEQWSSLAHHGDIYTLRWETNHLADLGKALQSLITISKFSIVAQQALTRTILAGLLAALAWPAVLVSAAGVIDNPWSVCAARAQAAGEELAEALIARGHGNRPVNLVGYGLGARVIFFCLKHFEKYPQEAQGIVHNVALFGCPVSSEPALWDPITRFVSGTFTNAFCRKDWILGFVFRTANLTYNIAGLVPIEIPSARITNIDVTDLISGHLQYETKLPQLLALVGLAAPRGNEPGPESIGSRVTVDGLCAGALAYFGVPKFSSDTGAWLGVVLDEPHGNCDGSFQGVQYFQCLPNHGILIPVKAGSVHFEAEEDYDLQILEDVSLTESTANETET